MQGNYKYVLLVYSSINHYNIYSDLEYKVTNTLNMNTAATATKYKSTFIVLRCIHFT